MKSEKGIASCVLSPSSVITTIDNANIKCQLVTEYPFRNTLKYIIETDKDVEFTLFIRIPGFAKSARINGQDVECGSFAEISRMWSDTTEIEVIFEFETEIINRPENMVVVRRGPLFYSVPIKEKWERVEYTANGVERKFPYCDYYIYPQSKWNYALVSENFEAEEADFEAPFNTENPPISIFADMAEIEWDFNNGHCDRLPKSTELISEAEKVKLIPYGCTTLRMTEFPYVLKK